MLTSSPKIAPPPPLAPPPLALPPIESAKRRSSSSSSSAASDAGAEPDAAVGGGDAALGSAPDRRWDKQSEEFILKMREKAVVASQQCMSAALFHRRMHFRVAVPSVLVPILMSPVSQLSECDVGIWKKHVTTGILVVLSVLSAVQTQMDFSKRAERYIAAAHRYQDIIESMDLVLSTPVEHRENVHDVTLRWKTALAALHKANTWVTTTGPQKLFRGWG